MSEKQKNEVIYADKETHDALSNTARLASVAAQKQVTIKATLKAMVEREKAESSMSGLIETVVCGGISFDVSDEKGLIDWDNLDKYPVKP